MRENRSWEVECQLGLVRQCEHEAKVTPDHDPNVTSTAKAAAYFREQGWVLHEDDRATCRICRAIVKGDLIVTSPGEVNLPKADD